MCKNKIYILFISFIVLFVTGCWDYRGLNEMIIVSGVAIDKLGDEYFLSFEIYDLQDTTTGEPIKTEIIQASGKTIFDAVRNAKKRTSNKLYFSESKILIISEEIAKEDGVNTMLNWFTRDPEIRETLRLVVSQEKTAFELLQTDSLTSNSVSSDIKDIVEKDSTVTGTTISTPLYKIYNILNSNGQSLTLPAVHLADNNGKKVCEVNGMALFKKDKLIGYLSSDESKYYLISVGKLKGGIITINTKLNSDDTDSQNLSLEIKRIRVSSKYTSTDVDDLKVKITASVDVTIGELKDQKEKLTEEDIVRLREEASSAIKDRMENVIKKIQNEYNTDVLGYGDILYRFHLKTWKNVKDDFEEKFVDISTDVECNVKIYNTGFIR